MPEIAGKSIGVPVVKEEEHYFGWKTGDRVLDTAIHYLTSGLRTVSTSSALKFIVEQVHGDEKEFGRQYPGKIEEAMLWLLDKESRDYASLPLRDLEARYKQLSRKIRRRSNQNPDRLLFWRAASAWHALQIAEMTDGQSEKATYLKSAEDRLHWAPSLRPGYRKLSERLTEMHYEVLEKMEATGITPHSPRLPYKD